MFKYFFTAALLAAPVCHADSNATLFATIKNWFKDPFGYTEERNNWLLRYEVTENYERRPLLQEISGFDSAKSQVADLITYAQDPVAYAQSQAEIYTNHIFYGLPGSGKSSFVRALMQEIKTVNHNFRIFEIPLEELLTTLFKDSSREDFINRFRIHAPCVIYIKNTNCLSPRIREILQWMSISTAIEIIEICNNLSLSVECPVLLLSTQSKMAPIDIAIAHYEEQMIKEGRWKTKNVLLSR